MGKTPYRIERHVLSGIDKNMIPDAVLAQKLALDTLANGGGWKVVKSNLVIKTTGETKQSEGREIVVSRKRRIELE
jgi:hypothetical protein